MDEVRAAYHQLVLLVGDSGSGKTAALHRLGAENSSQPINLNLKLAERLLDLTVKQRAVRVPGIVETIVRESDRAVAILDNVEMLFSSELSLDPLRLFQILSRNRTVVVAWPGEYEADVLTYAEPSHAEFRKYSRPQVAIVRIPTRSDFSSRFGIGGEV